MVIEETRHGAVTVLRPRGPIVEEGADDLVERARGAVVKSLGRVIVDATEAAYADSRGLEALLTIAELLSVGGGTLRVCGCSETLREILEVTGLSREFEHYDDVQMAVRSFL